METGLSELKELFELKDRDLRTYSPLTLAYIGDGVYELVIRTILVKKGNCLALHSLFVVIYKNQASP